ncbi:MAG: sigma-54-dependent Fis family transcriptional regulator [bacterium]|nr:sigma-54-dependent Fis family transcriptional regulator [bacterium]
MLQTDTRGTGELDAVKALPLRVPGLVILWHPDPYRVGEEVALPELTLGDTVRLSRLEPEFEPPGAKGKLRSLAEAHVSRKPLLLVPGAEAGSVTIECAESRTRVTVGEEPVEESRHFSAAEVERGVVFVLSRRIVLLLHLVDLMPVSVPHFGLVGESAAILRLRQEIRSAAEIEVPVLLRGETGTGKELVARAIHEAGRRRERPFVAVNMGALVPSLAASELFGAVRGAYTGAERKKTGFFQSAEGGTLFLDEIGEAPPEVQVLLLRTLESHEIQPVGSTETRKFDGRVIAATDVDLHAAIAGRRFRESLLHRLAGYEIRVPALRERRADVARLLHHFLRQELAEPSKLDPLRDTCEQPSPIWPPAELVARLVGYEWPGNVRQLRNVARRMAIARQTGMPEDVGSIVEGLLRESVAEKPVLPPEGGRRFRKPSEVSEEELLATLKIHRWHLRPAAAALGLSRATLYRLIEGCPRIRKAVELEPGEIEEALARCGGDVEAAACELEVSAHGLKRRITELGLSG